MQRKVQEMEEEAEKLKKLTDSVEEHGDGIDREEVTIAKNNTNK